ncbi:ralBP1-associated Eps domain-containing protein 2 isoform X2 [Nelusetta ayraudi]|uniref:ralBP1-associated Eps domain-containing protein 2 isoform X2 n=1 Tax=Nelusetta ayraudi TaxID=303726 RepID=UPI003F6F91AF
MEQEAGVAGTFIPLNEQEQRYYSGLRSLCQGDTSGKLSSAKVAELLRASQLPPESLHRVTEVCGAKRLGYFGPAQFFVAMKLLAAAQSGLPIHLESVSANLPLPRFADLKTEPEMRYTSVPPCVDVQGPQGGAAPGSASWTPAEKSAFRHPEGNTAKPPLQEARSPCSSPPRSPLTYRSYQSAKQRNGADAQSANENEQSSRPATAQLDQHSSPSQYTKPAAEQAAVAPASSSERLDQQGLDDYSDSDPWRITEEQLEYYTNQFRSLQPDLGALILGAVAKSFFTKSKLPIPELSHIWELSDVDRDGALTFSEFCTAFHLIVARKNGYPLPESLPATLRPEFLLQGGDAADTPESAEPLIVFESPEAMPAQKEHVSVLERLQPSLATISQDLKQETSNKDTGVRRTTQEKPAAFPQRPEPPQDLDLQMRTRSRPRSYSSTSFEDAVKKAEEPPTPPPRPQKSHSRASSLDLNKLFQQGAAGLKSGWLPPPPPPLPPAPPPPALPPRPSGSQVPHLPSESKVPQADFADFSRFREEEESSVKPQLQGQRSRFSPTSEDVSGVPKQDVSGGSHSQAPQKPVRRKFTVEKPNLDTVPPHGTMSVPTVRTAQKLPSRQRREIQTAIRKNKETNGVLTRLNSELQQQFKVVHQERLTLEAQLELLRPLTSA